MKQKDDELRFSPQAARKEKSTAGAAALSPEAQHRVNDTEEALTAFGQAAQLAAAARELPACNRIAAHYGLVLTPQQMQTLTERRFAALRRTGRIEFSGGILKALIDTFCDSPYLAPDNYEQTLIALQDLFYAHKGACREQLSDDELLAAMRLLWDKRAQGSLEYLAGVSPEELADAAQGILAPAAPEWETEEDE
ncbi:MAG: DUF6323 family protein [Faecalibacterium sp.]|jgi:hypothetical protein|nr:DUF6323 family protein [Faecalibacterium sp.]